MEQNNFYGQDFDKESQESLPTYDFTEQAPVYEQSYETESTSNEEVEASANSAFGKALASVIAANFPIASIVSIILGVLALKGVKKTDALAAAYGVEAGGKRTAAKIMGMIGTIYGSVLTAFYALYFGIYGCVIIAMIMSEL